VPGEGACLLRADGDTFMVAGVSGTAPATALGLRIAGSPGDPVGALAAQSVPFIGVTRPGQPAPPPELLPDATCWLAVPLAARGVPVGLLFVGSAATDAYTDAHLQIAAAVASQGMTAYDNACLFEQVNTMATVDPMTGVANRRHFLDLADQAFLEGAAGRRSVARPITAIMLDIDHFKRVNDTYGHLVGDTVIQEVGARLRSAVREGDLVGRYGGEEFAVLVVAEPDRADDLAQRLLDVVAASPVETSAGPLTITVSVGKARRRDGDVDLGALLGRADEALYRAKSRGRNRIEAAT
jgi:diguanylate cyclase (GGDEF)-like protein